jgi:hypothetical protein
LSSRRRDLDAIKGPAIRVVKVLHSLRKQHDRFRISAQSFGAGLGSVDTNFMQFGYTSELTRMHISIYTCK